MINYYDLGEGKQINEIVFAGSHDAGITSGKDYVQTQSIDILEQARAGVRLFDLRIAAAKATGTTDGVKNAELRAFHADGILKKDQTKTRYVPGLGERDLKRTSLRGGGFGMTLDKILGDARSFVESAEGSTEFLLLKFDKSTNWHLIAEACISTLDGRLYRDGGNLNKKTLHDLRGQVVVLFTPSGLDAVKRDFPPSSGILGIQNIASEGAAYRDDYDGLQYYGKGGTNPFNPRKKISQNEKKQAKLMTEGGHGNPEVMGMMYWTTTGLSGSIRNRNDKMWEKPNKAKLKMLWANGLGDAVRSGTPRNIDYSRSSSGPVIKRFMPNFVMIDFADDAKCRTIYKLNLTSSDELVALDDDSEL